MAVPLSPPPPALNGCRKLSRREKNQNNFFFLGCGIATRTFFAASLTTHKDLLIKYLT